MSSMSGEKQKMTKIDTKSSHITPVGGNIFTDLGFPPEEAAVLLAESKKEIAQNVALKKQLMAEIARWMNEQGLKQHEAAAQLHVSRPRVSDVVNAKTEKFTIDTLITMASNIGKKISVVIE